MVPMYPDLRMQTAITTIDATNKQVVTVVYSLHQTVLVGSQ